MVLSSYISYAITFACLTLFDRKANHVRSSSVDTGESYKIDVFHLIDNKLWGETDGSFLQGQISCPKQWNRSIECTFHSSDKEDNFVNVLKEKYLKVMTGYGGHRRTLQVSLYNIHTWAKLSPFPHYPSCNLPLALTMVESEESHRRFKKLFDGSFPQFHGNSTTNPLSTIQRFYLRQLNMTSLLPSKSFWDVISGASFVASTCHKGGGTTNREGIVRAIGERLRVDSLGKCMKTVRKDVTDLKSGHTAEESLVLKQEAISRYLFYLAFENTDEPGYVTEKINDALIAGTVPVYLGDSVGCKKLLPHPKAAIFVDDFSSIHKLTDYLLYLAANMTAYEEHRTWRTSFEYERLPSHFNTPWPCAVCQWAYRTAMDRNMQRQHAKKPMCT